MAAPPDFDQIAQEWCYTEDTDTVFDQDARRAEFVVVLKALWNARGAADAHAVEERLSTLVGWVTSDPYRQQLREAIDALNR